MKRQQTTTIVTIQESQNHEKATIPNNCVALNETCKINTNELIMTIQEMKNTMNWQQTTTIMTIQEMKTLEKATMA